ncbi:hypothetical protein BDW74DRAFT_189545 [Aspergillus multicolor]|uniref:uncharacterized protein n=1 Tax=Aspergillus multicolor TaxID=41759 RepID=UPI003CCE32F8
MAIIKPGSKPITSYNFLIIAFATFGSIAYGYSAAIIGSTLGQPSFLAYFGLDTASNSAALQGAINGLFQAGGLVGTLSFGVMADKSGRCKAILIATIVSIIGGALQAGSVHIAMFLVARFITGYGIGGLVMLVPLWQSEVAPPHARGLLVGLHGVSILCGYSLAAWVGFAFYFVDISGAQWHTPLALQCFPPLVLGVGILAIPESPRWLIENGHLDKAKATLVRIYRQKRTGQGRSMDDNNDDDDASCQFHQITAQLTVERALPSSWSSLFTVPAYRRRTLIGFTTLLAGQLTGTMVINNYGPTLYKSLGHGASASLALSAGWVTEGVVCNMINALLLDRVGRKWLMTTGLVGCAISLLGAAIMVALYGATTNQAGNSAGVFFLYLHLTFYGTCMDASTYVFASEIWPTHLRAKGVAVSCAGLFVGSLTLLEAAPTAFETIGFRFYMIMMALTLVCALLFACFWPETKALSLEEIAVRFGDVVVVDSGAAVGDSGGEQDITCAASQFVS